MVTSKKHFKECYFEVTFKWFKNVYNPWRGKLDNSCTVISKKYTQYSKFSSSKQSNAKRKKKEPKMNCDFWHDLHDLKLVVKLILNRPRTYLDSRKHDDTVNHY